ncbi:MAG: acyl--CoA ligase [Prevotella sp.]|nr:acyl--CoA ligase [Prevotella sp.]
MKTLEDYLRQNAEQYADKPAVICNGATLSYARLYRKVQQRASELRQRGVREGEAVVMRSSQDVEFLVQYFAIHLAGAVAVPLEKDTPQPRVNEISQQLRGADIPAGTADILFTTGTTGQSKGVMISHRAIVCNAENLIDGQQFSHDLVFIICGPLNHIGSLSKIYPVILLGATIYLLEGMKDLSQFFRALDYPCQKMATFLVPASIRILLQFGAKQLSAYTDKIDFVEAGGAPLAPSDQQALCEALPKSRLYNTYASTETGIICTYNYNDGRSLPGCLGRPMRHSRVFITSEGRVACQGPTLMTGYVGDSEKTAEVLHDDTLFTADNGELNDEGMLILQGRNDDVINIGGFKVAPSEVEDVALSFPGIKDCICIAESHTVFGSALKLLYVPSANMQVGKRELARYINARLESYKVPQLYEQVEQIYRTYNGKLDRKYYRQQ